MNNAFVRTAEDAKQAVIQGRINVLEERLAGHDCPSPSPHTCTQCWPIHVALNDLYRELNQSITTNL